MGGRKDERRTDELLEGCMGGWEGSVMDERMN
jgi:hypothetical protein